jgi:hypothetical protein
MKAAITFLYTLFIVPIIHVIITRMLLKSKDNIDYKFDLKAGTGEFKRIGKK